MSVGALAPQGWICPKCHKRFPEHGSPAQCPADGSLLLRNADLASAHGDPMIGRDIDGRFTILSRLGAGSMGTVYRARQNPVGREVAIKILRSERAVDDAAKARFLREARANSLLQSPHTVTVFDFGQSRNGELFLAMELLEGESLGQRIHRCGRIPAGQAVDVARQALRSLAEAHGKGIVHRDLKPDNLFFSRVKNSQGQSEEIVKVLDFGIAKMLGEGAGPLNAIETQAGTVFGTPRYMSPEQAQAKPLDARSDLYSLGVILYHMLAGRPPFTDDDAIIVMARHIKSTPKPFSDTCPDARIPPEIEACVTRALAKDPDRRPSNADQMAQELAAAIELARANTSGVRPSLASASGVLPASLPPPMMTAAPPPAMDSLELTGVTSTRSSWPWVIAAGALLGIGAFVVFMLARHLTTSTSAQTTTAATTAVSTATNPPAKPTATAPIATATSSSGKTVDVRSLPKATGGAPHPQPQPQPQPPHIAKTSTAQPDPAPTPTPTPAPTTSRPYGIFE